MLSAISLLPVGFSGRVVDTRTGKIKRQRISRYPVEQPQTSAADFLKQLGSQEPLSKQVLAALGRNKKLGEGADARVIPLTGQLSAYCLRIPLVSIDKLSDASIGGFSESSHPLRNDPNHIVPLGTIDVKSGEPIEVLPNAFARVLGQRFSRHYVEGTIPRKERAYARHYFRYLSRLAKLDQSVFDDAIKGLSRSIETGYYPDFHHSNNIFLGRKNATGERKLIFIEPQKEPQQGRVNLGLSPFMTQGDFQKKVSPYARVLMSTPLGLFRAIANFGNGYADPANPMSPLGLPYAGFHIPTLMVNTCATILSNPDFKRQDWKKRIPHLRKSGPNAKAQAERGAKDLVRIYDKIRTAEKHFTDAANARRTAFLNMTEMPTQPFALVSLYRDVYDTHLRADMEVVRKNPKYLETHGII